MRFTYTAIIKEVYDGDTITVDFDLGFGVWMKDQKIRFYGVNTPEVKGSSKESGLKVRDYVRSVLPIGSEVIIETKKDKAEKFGRWLGVIHVPALGEVTLNEDLLQKGMAVEFMAE